MSLPTINFLHFTVSEILPGQNFKGQGHYSKVKCQIKATPSPYQVLTSYTLRFPIYSPDKIFQSQGHCGKVKGQIKVTP